MPVRGLCLATTLAIVACSSEARPGQSRAGASPQAAPVAGSAAPSVTPPPTAAAGMAAPQTNSTTLIVPTAGAPAGAAAAADGCSEAAKLIYVVDEDGRFSSFNPASTPPSFVDIARELTCPAQPGFFGLVKPTPYSMSVDRNATAWVLYSTGELFRVDTAQGSCRTTGFQTNQSGFQLMGMGFVADAAMSNTDTLFVAGGEGPESGTASRLGTVDMGTLKVAPSGPLTGWPELTGNGLAELWAFYPDTSPPKIARLDKSTGAETKVIPLASLQGKPAAWAFAFWGGDFWIFLMRTDDTDTTVYRVKGSTGELTPALTNTGRHIVGAGVSTCAPVSLF